jgi:hypothetical protein
MCTGTPHRYKIVVKIESTHVPMIGDGNASPYVRLLQVLRTTIAGPLTTNISKAPTKKTTCSIPELSLERSHGIPEHLPARRHMFRSKRWSFNPKALLCQRRNKDSPTPPEHTR